MSSPIEKQKKEKKGNISDKNKIKNFDFNQYNSNSQLITKPNHKKSSNSIKGSKKSINEYNSKNEKTILKEKEEQKKKNFKFIT